MRVREWQKNFALLCASLSFVFVLAEVAARVLWKPGGQQRVIHADSLLGWSLKPGTHLHSVDTDRALSYHIDVNALGLRDLHRDQRPSPGIKRVLLLGDSMTFGTGVEVGQRCSEILDQRLGSRVEVLNGSVGGWGTDQEYLWLCQKGFDLKPDIVVLGLCVINDVINNMLPHEFLGNAPKPHFELRAGELVLVPAANRPAPSNRWKIKHKLQKSRIAHYVGRHLLLARARLKPKMSPSSEIPYYPENLETDTSHWSVFRLPYSPKFEEAFTVTERLIQAVHDSCDAHYVRLIVFAWPQKIEVDSIARHHELKHHGFSPEQFELSAPYDRLADFCTQLGVPFVYPHDAFERATPRQALFFERDPHPNAAGHALVASALLPGIQQALDLGAQSARR